MLAFRCKLIRILVELKIGSTVSESLAMRIWRRKYTGANDDELLRIVFLPCPVRRVELSYYLGKINVRSRGQVRNV